MSTEPRNPAATGGWWRRNRLWLAAALVASIASLGYSWHNAGEANALKNRVTPVNVGNGQQGDFEGARWRVLQARLIRMPDPRLRLHPDAALLVVEFAVTPAAGTELSQLNQCMGRVSDRQGRHWDAYGRIPADILDGAPMACGGGTSATATTGMIRFQHTYEVPDGIPLSDFHPEIFFLVADQSAPGTYLRFEL